MSNSELDSSNAKRHDHFNLSRRTLLKLSALTGAAVVASRVVTHPALGSVVSVPESGEGVIIDKWIPASCLNCSTRCATQVRVVNGKAVKITGNPLSQVSEGENCARAHIGLQVLYDPGRISGPLKRTNPVKGRGIDPKWAPVSWTQALGEVSERLKSLRTKDLPHQLLLLYGLNTISDEDIIHRFADAYGTPNVISGDALESEAEKAGEWMADGHYTQSAYDLARTNYILAFGASILESHKPLARNLRMWGKIRRERPNRAKVVVIDPRYSVTAAKSDQWIPISPGTDGALAMAIANVIISEGLYDADFIRNWTVGFNEYKELALDYYRPESVADITGIPPDTIRQTAREFALTRPAIAWRGRGATSWPNGAYSSYAIFCLNALVGSINVPGGVIYQQNPDYRPMPEVVEDDVAQQGKAKPRLDLRKTSIFPLAEVVTNQVADSILDGIPYPVEVAIGFNSNFNMSASGTWRWDEALKKVPYYVHIGPFVSEMAQYADIMLPACTFLEQWAYDHSPPGSGFAEVRIKQPVVEPLADTKGIIDIVFELARKLGGTVAQSLAHIGDDAEGFVRYRTESLIPWGEFREQGVWVGPAYEYHRYDHIFNTPSKKFEFYSRGLEDRLKETGKGVDNRLVCLPHYEDAEFLGDSSSYPLMLSTYQPLLNVENGSQNYPWAQEVFLVMHGMGWTNFVEINSKTAQALGIRDGDMVWVESPFNRIKVRARVFEGIHPQVVSISSGQGHYAYGRWAKGMGVNPNEIIGVDYDRISGQAAFFNTRVRVYRA
ncbi:molybdopterin-dependent oxidoreductase [Chloroflexota bacterium]